MNPWMIVGALVALVSVFTGGYYQGHKSGSAAQAVDDQKLITAANDRAQGIIDGYNQQIAEQKAVAEYKAIKQRDDVIALQAERDKFKSQLGVEHVKNRELTLRLSDAYDAYSLRFQATVQDGWCGGGTGSGSGTEGQPAGHARTTVVQLPDALTRDLRRLARDADELNDDYKLCRGYVTGTR